MRQINPEALAEAHAMHFVDTCNLLQRCNLTTDRPADALDMLTKPSEAVQRHDDHLRLVSPCTPLGLLC